MESFNLLLHQVAKNPNLAALRMICAQVEAWDMYDPVHVKEKTLRALAFFHADGTLSAEEDMLRLYKILAKHSRRIGSVKVFEKVEEQGRFICSLRFHILWAEAYAQTRDQENFLRVFELARQRLPESSMVELEAAFRDIADQYFPNGEIFNFDETLDAPSFSESEDATAGNRKCPYRRRSSAAILNRHAAKKMKSSKTLNDVNFGPKTRTKLRFVLVDRPEDGYLAPSIEELKAVEEADKQLIFDTHVVPMDISMSAVDEQAPATVLEREAKSADNNNIEVAKPSINPDSSQASRLPPPPPYLGQIASGDAKKIVISKVIKEHADEKTDDESRTAVKRPKFSVGNEAISGPNFSLLESTQDNKELFEIVTSTPAHPLHRPPTHEDFLAPLSRSLEETMKRKQQKGDKAGLLSINSKDKQSGTIGEADGSDQEDRSDSPNSSESSNPWDENLRWKILDSAGLLYQDCGDTLSPLIAVGSPVSFHEERYEVEEQIKEGSFVKAYKVKSRNGKTLSLKFKDRSCLWEVYICSEIRSRLSEDNQFIMRSIAQVDKAHLSNSSVIITDYSSFGTLMDISAKLRDPSWYTILLIAIQMAKILRHIHSLDIIHADVKPENFVVLDEINGGCEDAEIVINTPILKLTEWNRAIDMRVFRGHQFTGLGGNGNYDCPEMQDGRPWTYQCDYFGFVATLHMLVFGTNADVRNIDGVFKLQRAMKRRLLVRPLLDRIFEDFLNIPDCESLPNWDDNIQAMEDMFYSNFSSFEWRDAAAQFNTCL
ncbi:hypothetical protein Q1695_009520 [Nippostrongylus brasiliensis]|nr:hypothetical protein Q1695_009520 [Nippostrongylus brasiliensis]